ncbi:hypothetical protein F4802DRAFT_595942 [Xylaria palmicola]|nr:hypothetical protein F4802DRAFT_595942 [Xylaria palmicola]
MPASPSTKRIIVCCDGTWQNSDGGHFKLGRKPEPTLQIPSNVTRISRCFKRTCSDGVFQIIYYQSGVGSKSGILDRLFGGAFGTGISENIREAYAFLCANYVNGDEIVLLGFSRGAFTARSIGGMISDLGLLTREGMEYFYPIFKDMQNWTNDRYDDPFPTMPFTNKPKGENAAAVYRERLIEKGYSRAKGNNGQGSLIRVLAIGYRRISGHTGRRDIVKARHQEFYNTHLSNKIQHGFHALALDETRGPFTPTLWERRPQEQATSDLRQVWFPGDHANIGGGWPDQGVANTTLAWMMDQLSSVGCEFRPDALDRAFAATVKFYTNREPESALVRYSGAYPRPRRKRPMSWADEHIYEPNKPVRPWALHGIKSTTGPLYNLVGSVSRAPGMYRKIDPKSGRTLPDFLEDTNERVHPSVRVRLACAGLGTNDSDVWQCASLLHYWRPRRVPLHPPDQPDSAADAAATSAEGARAPIPDASERWVWEYIGPEHAAPAIRVMAEESLGPFEQRLLGLAAGKVHVYQYAEEQDVEEFKAFHLRSFRKAMKLLHKKWHAKHQAAQPAPAEQEHRT